ncbi:MULTISPECIES: SulP family inorganic anion transporter [unclassified Leifsonia]|uniref:SulP family inorganic anion transporter n=1 Tax=unclassified Leifsonia TaxID=2663824 RepID=UPI0006F3B16D|nr:MULTISPECIES: SulP family inorganic anion transporter [unclassified Leifsonia]KQX04942.1 sulfate transporter [Leifsonia sp. Root1293]KRA08574.1 sulfate transporter [Leifsonia sp. Root60]
MTEEPQPASQSQPTKRFPRLRSSFARKSIGRDAMAGLVLGVESVPDGLAAGLLAGLNPVSGLYAYLFGMMGAALFTSSSFMAVQATGAMSLVVADAAILSRPDPAGALVTLGLLTGVIMVGVGLLKGGRLLRFVPTAVMTGFITAVGVNIVLGQLGNFTGYAARGDGRIQRTFDLLLNIGGISWPTLLVGVLTIAGIVLLQRTPLRAMGMVVAVILGSALAVLFADVLGLPVALVRDITEVPAGLPGPVLPDLGEVVPLFVPALSLALVGLVQGAAVSGAFRNVDGRTADASRDFIGQGAGNILSGLFQGAPVGGSMSGSALIVAAGARSRLAFFFAGGVMALIVLTLSGIVGFVAMPALAALLIVVGVTTVKPAKIASVARTGPVQTVVMATTFVLTLIIPLQFAVLFGVGLGIILYVASQSNRLRLVRLEFTEGRRMRETQPPGTLPGAEVVVLQPYGSLFFASAPTFSTGLPMVTAESAGSVVVIRLRGVDEIGLSLIDVLRGYATRLQARGSLLKLVVSNDHVLSQLKHEKVESLIGPENVYRSTEWVGDTVLRAVADAEAYVAAQRPGGVAADDGQR